MAEQGASGPLGYRMLLLEGGGGCRDPSPAPSTAFAGGGHPFSLAFLLYLWHLRVKARGGTATSSCLTALPANPPWACSLTSV